MSFRVPTNLKSAIEDLAWQRSSKHEPYKQSWIGRQALEEYVARHKDELSEEARDDLDDDLLANGGGSS